MATGRTLRVDIAHGSFGSFGSTYLDITRQGATSQSFWYEGERGSRTSVQARTFFRRKSDARDYVTAVEAMQGSEVRLKDAEQDRSAWVFLHGAIFEPLRAIVSSDGKTWAAYVTLDIQRTS